MIRVLRTVPEIEDLFGRLHQRLPGEDVQIRQRVQEIVNEVGRFGEVALRKLREELEGVPKASQLLLSANDELLSRSATSCSAELRSALRISVDRVRRYHEIQRDQDRVLKSNSNQDCSWSLTSRVQPLERVAVYVPGGSAFYPSSVIMSVVPAQVAGVKEVILVTPYRSIGNPAFAATVQELGVSQILATGGAQGVAAAAFGFEGFSTCDKIVGPGNVYVATAKHILAGRIGIDGFAGPSEILLLGDGTSDPEWIAADLVAQAEHDELASAIFASTCETEAEAVSRELESAIFAAGERSSIARKSIETFGAVIKVENRDDLLSLSNRIHPEHLHIHTSCALHDDGRNWWSNSLKGVGAVFFGRYCSEAFGDYLAGPSHVLPTAGTARFASPLGVYDFVRRSSLIWMDASEAARLAETTATMADAEELPGHARSARLRAAHLNFERSSL